MTLNQGQCLGLSPQRCHICAEVSNTPVLCGDCRAFSFCGYPHEWMDDPEHRSACDKIQKARQNLAYEKAKLRSRFPGLTEDYVGSFWNQVDTLDYMMARYAAAKALLDARTLVSVREALEHFRDMVRLSRDDNMGMRNYVPALLLRLGEEQACYDFLTKWGTHPVSHDVDIRNANAFEPVDKFAKGALTLSHLASLTLLKLRLYLDLQAMEQKLNSMLESMAGSSKGYSNYGGAQDRTLGQIAKAWVRPANRPNIPEMTQRIKAQYIMLCLTVHNANQHFWDALVNTETPALPTSFTPGSREEADMAVFHCKPSWRESEGALAMVKADTSHWVGVDESSRRGVPSTGGSHAGQPVEVARKKIPICRGTGQVFPSEAITSSSLTVPGDLFDLNPSAGGGAARFLQRNRHSSILVYTDGSCLNNGQHSPRGGWAVVYGPGQIVSGRLEEEGPFGDVYLATSNRAELRAVIAALRLCDWRADGFDSITIATDSTYIVNGTTDWTEGWFRNGWKTGTGLDVKNKDMWELIQGEVERWAKRGLTVKFWKIPRWLNTEADDAAKTAANQTPVGAFADVAVPPQAARNLILMLCLERKDVLDANFRSFFKRITSKANLIQVMTPEAAVRELSQEKRPPIILITDAAIARQSHEQVLDCVADCLFDGSTVVLCGSFSSLVNANEFRSFFAKLGLPWALGSYHRATVSLRLGAVGEKMATRLALSYSQTALFVKNVDRLSVWYAERGSSSQAAVAFTRVGKGRLGYIGDVNGEEASTSAVMAMCGLR